MEDFYQFYDRIQGKPYEDPRVPPPTKYNFLDYAKQITSTRLCNTENSSAEFSPIAPEEMGTSTRSTEDEFIAMQAGRNPTNIGEPLDDEGLRRYTGLPEAAESQQGGPVKVVFVCMGNTDRSPMAEALARQMLGNKAVVSSAGVKQGGRPASENANLTMKKFGLDVSGHVSRKLDKSIVDDNDLVVFLDRTVAFQLKKDIPKSKFLMTPIPNPFKTDPNQFLDVALRIREVLQRLVVPLVTRIYQYKNQVGA